MDDGQRHRHRRRGGGESSSRDESSERLLVLPGEELPVQGLQPGPGTYRVGGRIFASVLGLLQRKPPMVRVVPLSGRYAPHAGDTVIGIVTDVQGSFWLLDIGAARWAPLHMTGTPWKIEFGETGQHLRVGDAVVVAVEQIENTGRIGVTMNGEGLGKLESGTLVTISPARIPRVIGKGGSMINTIMRATGCSIVVGQNGRVWVDGRPEDVARVRASLDMIELEGPRRGLTERIERLLSTRLPGEANLPSRPSRDEVPDPADILPTPPETDVELDREPFPEE